MVSETSVYDDEQLVLFVRENNDEAKDYIYNKFSPLIHKEISRVRKRAEILGIELADLSQEAMLGFSHAINNFKEDEDVKFITFATLCIRRGLAKYIAKFETGKSRMMKTAIPLDAPIDDTQTPLVEQMQLGKDNDPLNELINTETLSEVQRKMVESLSDNERKVLELDLDGNSPQEIAKIMDMNDKQIYNLLHRARKKIKN